MKKIIVLTLFMLSVMGAFAQETLQTVYDRGSNITTSNIPNITFTKSGIINWHIGNGVSSTDNHFRFGNDVTGVGTILRFATTGESVFSFNVSAPSFTGDLTGTASNATKWNNFEYDFSSGGTTLVALFGSDGYKMRGYQPVYVKSFLGLGSLADLNNSSSVILDVNTYGYAHSVASFNGAHTIRLGRTGTVFNIAQDGVQVDFNIDGNAATSTNATKWGGVPADFSAPSTSFGAFMALNPLGVASFYDTSIIQTALGLGSAAYTSSGLYYQYKGNYINSENANLLVDNGSYLNTTGNGTGNSNFPEGYGVITTAGNNSNYLSQMHFNYDGSIKTRVNWGGSYTSWKELQFKDQDGHSVNDGSTLNNNISGKWNGQGFFAGLNTTVANLMSFDGSNNVWRPAEAPAVASFLGLGSSAYTAETLQSVRNRNSAIYSSGTTDYGVAVIGTTGATNIFLAGQNTVTNGFTVKYDGTDMQYGFLDGIIRVNMDANTSGAPGNAQLQIGGKTHPTKHISLGYNTSSNYGEIQSQTSDGNYTAIALNPNGGNVGIGTATPAEKLSVNGKIRAKEVKIEPVNNWPDYVFEEDYKPTSLAELENYIKTEKHLPEIPSAKEVEKNGIELGEMNKLLLKKVEELTLILIEQGKAVQQLKDEVKALKQKQ